MDERLIVLGHFMYHFLDKNVVARVSCRQVGVCGCCNDARHMEPFFYLVYLLSSPVSSWSNFTGQFVLNQCGNPWSQQDRLGCRLLVDVNCHLVSQLNFFFLHFFLNLLLEKCKFRIIFFFRLRKQNCIVHSDGSSITHTIVGRRTALRSGGNYIIVEAKMDLFELLPTSYLLLRELHDWEWNIVPCKRFALSHKVVNKFHPRIRSFKAGNFNLRTSYFFNLY